MHLHIQELLPKEMDLSVWTLRQKQFRIEALDKWVLTINSLNNDTISSFTGSDSYLAKEIEYANGVGYKEDFIRKVVATVSYEPGIVEAVNVYGNPLLDENDEVFLTESLVNDEGEKVTLHYIDYSEVKLDSAKIKSLMKEIGLSVGDVDYSNKLVEVFCKYMISLDSEKIPLVSAPHVPNLVKTEEGYGVSSEEDIALDKALFSSEDFYKLLEDFSLVASGGNDVTEEWKKWDALPKEEKEKTKEPQKTADLLQPREEWLEWNSLSYSEKKVKDEPTKYDYKKIVSMDWCGSYYLVNEYSYRDDNGNIIQGSVSAEVGDGTFDNPAGLNTDIVTSIFVLEENESGELVRIAKPIRVRLIEYGVSQDAIDYFESKDERNRGFDIKSEVQYAYYTFEVTNLSDKALTIYDDSS